MKPRIIMGAACATALSVALLACGGGASDGTSASSGGTGGTGIAYGSVTGFGSVFVNGIEFDTSSTIFLQDGSGGFDQSDLAVGMVVRVQGTIDASGRTGAADTISYKHDLDGPISRVAAGVAPGEETITVLGQIVIVDGQTQVYPSQTRLMMNDMLSISGLVDDQGRLRATYVRKKSDPFIPNKTEVELKGAVAALNTVTKTFQINAVTVNYGAANVGDLNGGLPREGDFVEAKGTLTSAVGTLMATQVEPEDKDDEIHGVDGVRAEIQGYVAQGSATAFSVGNQAVQSTSGTRYENGAAASVVPGAKVEVEGSLAAGVLIAEKISFP